METQKKELRDTHHHSHDLIFPPWLFKHENLMSVLDSSRTLEKEKLANIVNYIHFKGGHIHALMDHPRYRKPILVKITPELCEGEELSCRWDEQYAGFNLTHFKFQSFVIMDGQTIILVPADITSIDEKGIKTTIPQKSYILSKRHRHRFFCSDVNAELMQSGFLARGKLIDFSSLAFRVHVNPESPFSHHRFDAFAPSTIRLCENGKTLFSGKCTCIRSKQELHRWEIVFSPSLELEKLTQPKKIRHPRLQIYPPPVAMFDHPFSKKKMKYEIFDISTTGFSLYDDMESSTLIPGMIIHELSIIYAGELKINCSAQVVQCRPKDENTLIYGISILDMDIHSYSRLSRILSMNMDPHTCISTEVDLEALWEFFFDTGFIYPQKYKSFQKYKEEFKRTYERLYTGDPAIARHLTYEKNGQIYAHMSMIRAYERSWLLHHHAARPLGKKRTGFVILRQMTLFLYGMYHLPSAKMDYVLAYYRPDNEFPDRVFGSFARELNDPQICSLDLYSYHTIPVSRFTDSLPEGWSLHESSYSELWELEQFYRNHSGGLFIDVLSPFARDTSEESLEKVARRLGFIRKWTIYSLCHNGYLKAILIVNQSDVGANLSELLNGIKVIVIEPEDLSWEILSTAVSTLTCVYHTENIPLLLYPASYIDTVNAPREKYYYLWIGNMRYYYKFLEYMQKYFRMQYD